MSGVRVAILDDYQHLSSEYTKGLSKELHIDVYDDTISPDDEFEKLVARLEPYEVISTMRERTPIRKALIDRLPNLKILLTTAMRNKGIDISYAQSKGIVVAGTPIKDLTPGSPPDFATTVQHTWALILSLTNNIPRDHSLIPAGQWNCQHPLNTYIGGHTLGILGLGKLGVGTARIGRVAFGMKIIAWSENLTQEKADQAAFKAGLQKGDFQVVTKNELFEQSDILSLHNVLSNRSKGMVGKDELGRMKSSAFLINTSRGALVQEEALLEVLKQGKIRGAALDVFDIEPLPENSPWRTTEWGKDGSSEVVYTPHTGYSYDTQIRSMWESTRANLERIAKGERPEWELKE